MRDDLFHLVPYAVVIRATKLPLAKIEYIINGLFRVEVGTVLEE